MSGDPITWTVLLGQGEPKLMPARRESRELARGDPGKATPMIKLD